MAQKRIVFAQVGIDRNYIGNSYSRGNDENELGFPQGFNLGAWYHQSIARMVQEMNGSFSVDSPPNSWFINGPVTPVRNEPDASSRERYGVEAHYNVKADVVGYVNSTRSSTVIEEMIDHAATEYGQYHEFVLQVLNKISQSDPEFAQKVSSPGGFSQYAGIIRRTLVTFNIKPVDMGQRIFNLVCEHFGHGDKGLPGYDRLPELFGDSLRDSFINEMYPKIMMKAVESDAFYEGLFDALPAWLAENSDSDEALDAFIKKYQSKYRYPNFLSTDAEIQSVIGDLPESIRDNVALTAQFENKNIVYRNIMNMLYDDAIDNVKNNGYIENLFERNIDVIDETGVLTVSSYDVLNFDIQRDDPDYIARIFDDVSSIQSYGVAHLDGIENADVELIVRNVCASFALTDEFVTQCANLALELIDQNFEVDCSDEIDSACEYWGFDPGTVNLDVH